MLQNYINKIYRGILRLTKYNTSYFSGNYKSFEEASKRCRGYSDDIIIDKVEEAIKAVLEGKAKYERDSYLFYNERYEFSLLSSLLLAYSDCDSEKAFTVVDWGGSLGSCYLQHKTIFDKIFKKYKWVIVEQSNYVQRGKEIYSNDQNIIFIDYADADLKRKIAELHPDCVQIRSALQYIPVWREVLDIIKRTQVKWLLIDRLPLYYEDRICIQKVPEYIYDAEYPIHLFVKEDLLSALSDSFTFIQEETDNIEADEYLDGKIIQYRALLFKRK
ncbi:MAG: methyltransferase, TIGR04325 family [Lachnospiraceae bacterium]|nr:methyltransferase, TIGR04325 family [Lachnospiraceae bacterium]